MEEGQPEQTSLVASPALGHKTHPGLLHSNSASAWVPAVLILTANPLFHTFPGISFQIILIFLALGKVLEDKIEDTMIMQAPEFNSPLVEALSEATQQVQLFALMGTC